MANLSAPDQIRRVVRTIVLSSEFRSAWGQKIKRPFELVASYLRATGAELPADQVLADPNAGDYWGSLLWNYGQAGGKVVGAAFRRQCRVQTCRRRNHGCHSSW